MKDEALKLALDDLIAEYDMETSSFAKRVDEIFKQALAAQPAAQEPVAHSYASTQATMCACCGERKHTPLRIDKMGGYVCLTCIDKKLGSLLGEFGHPAAQPAVQEVRLWDTQWTNVVNHNNAYRGWDKQDAINHAVKMTEQYIAKNVLENKCPPAQPEPVRKAMPENWFAGMPEEYRKEALRITTPPAAPVQPIGEVIGRHEYAGLGQIKHVKTIEWFGEPAPVGTKLYTTPPEQPAVPDAIHHTDLSEHPQYIEGWNDCRQAMLEMMK